MIANYLKTSIRSLLKYKYYSIINIMGLALGITCVFLILQYLRVEFSYDQFHNRAGDIYRVSWENSNPQTRTPHPLAQAMATDFPEVETAVSLTPLWGAGLTRETYSIKNNEKDIRYDETNILAVDTTFFKVFSFDLVKGDANTALKKVGGILLSEKAAHKYFADENPLGKFLSVNNDKTLVEVVGVFKDVPELSHFHFDLLVSYVTEKALEDPGSEFFTWKDFGHYNYVKLKPGANAKMLESRLMPWLKKYVDWTPEDFAYLAQNNYSLRLQPITDIHLHSNLRWELEPNGNIEYAYMMIAAAILIMIVACINFINLSTAQYAMRAKEIGIRKSFGAFRKQVVVQFTSESILVACIASVLAVVFIELTLPFFKTISHPSQSIDITTFALTLSALTLIVGLVAGLYPSFYLSAVKPVEVLKGKLLQSPGGTTLRDSFTVIQFVSSMVLICASVIIYGQMKAIRNKSLGFNKEEVVILPIKNHDEFEQHHEQLFNALSNIKGVSSVSATSNIPGRSFDQHRIFASANPEQYIDANEMIVSHDFLRTLDISIAEGRDFLRDNPADVSNAFLLNQTAANQLGLDQPVGKEITWIRNENTIKGTVVGIVKDFHFQSLHNEVQPLLIKLYPQGLNYVAVKLNTGNFSSTLSSIEDVWNKFDGRFAFNFFFLSDNLNQQYTAEQNMANVLLAFAITAIIIACFGLLGIAALSFRTKTKEISIRKVLGANYSGLLVLLLKKFTLLILTAVIISVPIVYIMMNSWLQNFSYHIQINPLIFVVTGGSIVLLAWLTLAYLTSKVASVNPATTLKNE